jgi:hypothetical protein
MTVALEERCEGTIADVNPKFSYFASPICYLGRGGGYKYYQFSFASPPETLTACHLNPLGHDLVGKSFKDIKCKPLRDLTPNLVVLHFFDTTQKRTLPQMTQGILDAIYWSP